MKFLYSDTHDYVDPGYDFIGDRNSATRHRYWGDVYAHELMDPVPYDGLLVAMSAVVQADGVPRSKVRYSTAEMHRMLREGARKFLRMDGRSLRDAMLMGDCGAFAYATLAKPPYALEQVAEFYLDGGFTHGVSPDHIIFDCDLANPPRTVVSAAVQERYDITLNNAEAFLGLTKSEGGNFVPVGAVQGWSPASMAESARALEAMGYRYLAIGGLVPLRADAIHCVLRALRQAIQPQTHIHLLGFAKAEQIGEFTDYGITSFDSTSPLIRAFKDARANYYMPAPGGGLAYYSAIRIPQAIENPRLMRGIKKGIFSAEDLQRREAQALTMLRAFDKGRESLESTLDAVTEYQEFLGKDEGLSEAQRTSEVKKSRVMNRRTLTESPWKHCECSICSQIGVEVIIFRSSNRNKRRGFHNLGVYHRHLQTSLERVV